MARYRVRANFDLIDAWQESVITVEAPAGLDEQGINDFLTDKPTSFELEYLNNSGEYGMEIDPTFTEIIETTEEHDE